MPEYQTSALYRSHLPALKPTCLLANTTDISIYKSQFLKSDLDSWTPINRLSFCEEAWGEVSPDIKELQILGKKCIKQMISYTFNLFRWCHMTKYKKFKILTNGLAYVLTHHLHKYDHTDMLNEDIKTSETDNLDIFSLLES